MSNFNLGMKIGFLLEFVGIILIMVFFELKSNVPYYVIALFVAGVITTFVSMIIRKRNNTM